MPKPRSTAPGDLPQPAPVGLLLPRTRVLRTSDPGVPDWHGLSPSQLAYLIRRYTAVGGVVLDLDAHPAASAATVYLRRVPARLITDRHSPRVQFRASPPGHRNRRAARRTGACVDLILATLPQQDQSLDASSAATTMRTWLPLLRPGGFLLVGLTAPPPSPGEVSYRATVIAAARTAGLFYHQRIPAILAPVPEHEPRTAPEHPGEADDGRRLLDGRHLPTFRDLLAFGTTASGEETTRV
ncbi:class I SAM-dependent methyltransferase [Micromonospora craniellae]|uniref:Class I SAM-dependent methyltransferase n=1 Tax=Micromonospora craniellae TaxID=2294034 RepID=A0A372FQL0_9ACTN|nr:hypothetical protein [Micromonospora craniellae]QOC92235.1 hypothetical protein ID554_31120 [Micromonospora craniellae]RFS40979.1 hypothetical protein D0Q02_29920 [Micromonospora craniellae]